MKPEQEARLQRLADRMEIHDAMLRYCRGVDRCDRELIASAFHPDAVDNHGKFQGRGDNIPDQILNSVRTGSVSSMHCLLNHLVEIDGDKAWSEAYFVRWNIVSKDGPALDTRAGRYVDRFERRQGEWKIVHRIVINEWTDVSALTPNGTDDKYAAGVRTKEDISYQAR